MSQIIHGKIHCPLGQSLMVNIIFSLHVVFVGVLMDELVLPSGVVLQ